MKISFSALALLLFINLTAQQFQWLDDWQGNSPLYLEDFQVESNQKIWFCGTFNDTLFYRNDTLISPVGSMPGSYSEGFYGYFDPNGQINFRQLIRGTHNVRLDRVKFSGMQMVFFGSYEDQLYTQNDTLNADPGSPPLNEHGFVYFTDLQGNAINASILGNAVYFRIADVDMDTLGNFYVLATFQDEIYLMNQLNVVQGYNLIVMKVNQSGSIVDYTIMGPTDIFSNAKRSSIEVTLDGQKIFVASDVQDSIKIGNTWLYGNGVNPVAFIVALDNQLNPVNYKILNSKYSFVNDLHLIGNMLYFTGYADDSLIYDTFQLQFSNTRAFLGKADFALNLQKLVFDQQGSSSSRGIKIENDLQGNLYWAYLDHDTLMFLGQMSTSNNLVAGIIKITGDTLMRYNRRLFYPPAVGELLFHDLSVDTVGDVYFCGKFFGQLTSDTLIKSIQSNKVDPFSGKIDCTPLISLAIVDSMFCKGEILQWNFNFNQQFYQLYVDQQPASNPVNITQAGTYEILLEDEIGCRSQSYHFQAIQYPQVDYQITAGCDTVFFQSNGIVSFEIFQNGQLLQTGSDTMVLKPGEYVFLLTDSNQCRYIDTIVVQQGEPLVILHTCDSLTTEGGDTVIWYFNGVPVDTAVYLIAETSGQYTAVPFKNPCRGSGEILLDVLRMGYVKPLANPADEVLKIKYSLTRQSMWHITDLSGNKVLSGMVSPTDNGRCGQDGVLEIPLERLPAGFYIFTLDQSSGNLHLKFVKQ